MMIIWRSPWRSLDSDLSCVRANEALAMILLVSFAGCSTRVGQVDAKNNQACLHVEHANGKPCKPGWKPERGFFTERDGSKQDACVQAGEDPSCQEVDVLKPGESAPMTMKIEIPGEAQRKL